MPPSVCPLWTLTALCHWYKREKKEKKASLPLPSLLLASDVLTLASHSPSINIYKNFSENYVNQTAGLILDCTQPLLTRKSITAPAIHLVQVKTLTDNL